MSDYRFVRPHYSLPRGVFALPREPDPEIVPTSTARAWIQGVIDTCFAVESGLTGASDGKVYHKLEVGSAEEMSWQSACQWTSQKMMEGAMMREELRKSS